MERGKEGERDQIRGELVALIHGVLDAESYKEAEIYLAALKAHQSGEEIWKFLNVHLDAASCICWIVIKGLYG